MSNGQKQMLILAAMVCLTVVVLFIASRLIPDNPGANDEPPPAPAASGAGAYADCVHKVFARLEQTDRARFDKVSASIDKWLALGPEHVSEESRVVLQQELSEPAQKLALQHCADKAGGGTRLMPLTVDLDPPRKDVAVLKRGGAEATCTTDQHGGCVLLFFDAQPDKRFRVLASSAQYAAEAIDVGYPDLERGFASLKLSPRQEGMLTIVAQRGGSASNPSCGDDNTFFGEIALRPRFGAGGGEITSDVCHATFNWSSVECRNARADDYGRAVFYYTGTLEQLDVDLNYRNESRKRWSGTPPESGRVDVTWEDAHAGAAPTHVLSPARVLPCGSKPALEALLGRVPWAESGVVNAAITVDANGAITTTRLPSEADALLRAQRIRVSDGCKPETWRFAYQAKQQ